MRLGAIFLAASVAVASAQPAPTEHVTVTGTRSRPVIDSFVQSFVKPARMTGKFARWEDRICPVTVGLRPAATAFVTHRVKEIAAQAGAPVNDHENCRANIAIVFSKKPQALLDDIKRRRPQLLGYYDNASQRDALAIVSHPIQAWYMTATKDLRGNMDIDSPTINGIGHDIDFPCDICASGKITLSVPRSASVTGSRLGDGLRSAFYDIIIVADPTRLADYEIGALADYISLLALAQLNSLDTCQQLSSIVNLLAPACAQKPNALTESDLAYLRGLYKMGPDRTSRIQQDEIAYQMEQSLNGK